MRSACDDQIGVDLTFGIVVLSFILRKENNNLQDQATYITEEISKELSSLLSDLLERKWMEAVPSEMDAFTFTVTWPSMINYLNMPRK